MTKQNAIVGSGYIRASVHDRIQAYELMTSPNSRISHSTTKTKLNLLNIPTPQHFRTVSQIWRARERVVVEEKTNSVDGLEAHQETDQNFEKEEVESVKS